MKIAHTSLFLCVALAFATLAPTSTKAQNLSETAQNPSESQQTLKERLAACLDAAPLTRQSQVAALFVDLTTGDTLLARHIAWRMRPASTNKVVTAVTALDILGPAYRYTTSILTSALPDSTGTVAGDVYVRGGFDPLLSRADVRALCDSLAAAGIRRVAGNICFDLTMKDANERGEGWCWDDDDVPLIPLQVEGRPSRAAGAFADALAACGIALAGQVGLRAAAPFSALVLGRVHRPISAVLAPMMKQSDNNCAESLFYQFCATAKDGAARVQQTLTRAQSATGGTVRTADGSGLSLYNYQTVESLVSLLTYASRREAILGQLLPSLPVMGVDGTLAKRGTGTAARGKVRAKTGTVTGISSLAGYITTSHEHTVVFAIICAGQPKAAPARDLQDALCALVAGE